MTPTPNDMAVKINGRPVDTGGPTGTHRVRERNSRRADPAPVQSTLLSGVITAAQLDRMTFAPLVEHVPHLITEGFEAHISKGYIYFAMGFSAAVEGLNLWAKRRSQDRLAPH